MRQTLAALVAVIPPLFASQNVFSVHDDLLAFPQYEVIFSNSLISDTEVRHLVEHASSSAGSHLAQSVNTNIDSQSHIQSSSPSSHAFDPSHETYELMYHNGEQHLCTIPIVDIPPKNETSEAEARVAQQKELARATNRGWELLQDLEGNCLYFVSGWWSYSFCYNSEITQFHQLPPKPGKRPQPDPTTLQYVLGRAKGKQSKEDEWGNEIDVRKEKKATPPKTELQVKGDTRYLVQKMEGGTICDLTGKPRRVEVQYHCNPHLTDRIGYIKEVTTCTYVMVVYTPRLCSDVAFLPPKENKAHAIVCRVVVPEHEITYRTDLKTLEAEIEAAREKDTRPVIGGLIVGAGKYMNKEGARMPAPPNFNKAENLGTVKETIARGQSQADGGKVESVSNNDLQNMNLDPDMVEGLKREVAKIAKEKGWKIEVVDAPGEVREILGIVDGEEEDEGDGEGEEGKDQEGSEEIYKDEL